jgi:hypothetical protein
MIVDNHFTGQYNPEDSSEHKGTLSYHLIQLQLLKFFLYTDTDQKGSPQTMVQTSFLYAVHFF